ncbi:Zn-ribbon domain-containing OB-fold protein [Variovorax sp. dw_308]|uniref:Zn-ribbon domain-containing OB-fold protein n=1 Tax=Variovorax sp. dw_308 TaxID=2721546 RepID=UPI001C4834DF|nr:OB-fold domain-containing protein [Variovorax sp. dw_308]
MLTQPNLGAFVTNPGVMYREGVAQGLLRYMKCRDCESAQTLARYACGRCGSTQLDWLDSDSTGTVYAVTTVTRAPSDEFRALVPYTLVLVDLREGSRVMGHGEPGLMIGDAVIASFAELKSKGLVLFCRTSERRGETGDTLGDACQSGVP